MQQLQAHVPHTCHIHHGAKEQAPALKTGAPVQILQTCQVRGGLDIRDDLGHSLGSPSAGRDDVACAATTTTVCTPAPGKICNENLSSPDLAVPIWSFRLQI